MENAQQPLTIKIFQALIPLLLLGGVVYLLLTGGPTKFLESDLPPIEEIHVLKHSLEEDLITLDVINSGPDPITIAQVMVRGAFWFHEMLPQRELEPLQSAKIIIPFPWNEGEPIEIGLLTSTGLVFDYEIEVATRSPVVTISAISNLAILGIYVGVIPVALGICWLPFLRQLRNKGINFFLYLTVGLLAFLAQETIVEGLEIAGELPEIFHGTALFLLGFVGVYLILFGIESKARERSDPQSQGMIISWLIAFSIGLHNLGEGLAIGSAYALGELALGAMLVVGFTIHNITEGIAIVAPILKERINLKTLIQLGLLAGAPTIIGCWIGAFTYSQMWSLLFLGIGAGAIVQVMAVIIGRKSHSETLQPLNILGLFIGYMIMYATGLLV